MSKNRRVIKFGGTSLSAAGGLNRVNQILTQCLETAVEPVLVVSAFEGASSQLSEMSSLACLGDRSYRMIFSEFTNYHQELLSSNIIGEITEDIKSSVNSLLEDLGDLLHGVYLVKDISTKTSDLIASFGEQLSARIVCGYLQQEAHRCCVLDSRELIVNEEELDSTKVDFEKTKQKIKAYFEEISDIPVVTGYISSQQNKLTTSLSRGASDYTAALLGAALGADEIQLWTDVDGVMTADPRKVPKAFTIEYLSYEEAMELCHFGAQVIYPPTLQPALDAQVPIRIKNSFSSESPGSLIVNDPPDAQFSVTGISSIHEIALIQLEGSGMIGVAGVAKRLFDALSKEQISVILISQASSEHSICFAVAPSASARAKQAIETEFALEIQSHQIRLPQIEDHYSVVAAVGSNMRHTPGISGKLFQALGKNGINVSAIAQGSSELNISVVIDREDEAKALNALHEAFFLSDLKTLNVFMVGTGQVGAKLLEQVENQTEYLQSRSLDLRIVALANSRKMLFNLHGVPLDSWRSAIEKSPDNMDTDFFIREMRSLNLPNSIFVDCTASETMAQCYLPILASSISIVTPNKKANSETFERYCDLQKQAKKANVKFFYETTVGAGLPVIGTLYDLISSGDEIIRIEAVLSGTLSYIFNSFTNKVSFSEVVRTARDKGYTEPDPRDDLSGMDVARKLLILAREMNIPLELDAVEVASLIPEHCRDDMSVEDFLEKLKDSDFEFEQQLAQAEEENKRLRYIGIIEKDKAHISLQAVAMDHPFYSLSGSDNIISFFTKRYSERPLVVKGPGAGTDVTAAGVLADIIRVASYLI